jgi:hypothetical protein
MKRKFLFLSMAVLHSITFFSICQVSSSTISFFIRPLPRVLDGLRREEKSLEMPKSETKKILNKVSKEFNPERLYSGIYVSYLGQLARSDIQGHIVFPRKSIQSSFHLLVTPEIKPLLLNVLNRTSIIGLTLATLSDTSYYLYELVDSPETGLLTWYINEKPLPDTLLPLDVIIVFAHPQDIMVPVGTTATTASNNLLLPDIYITNTAQPTSVALQFLKLRNLFSPVEFKYNYLPQGYQKLIL